MICLDEVFGIVHNLFSDYYRDLAYQKIQSQLLNKISLTQTNDFFEDLKINNLIIFVKQNITTLSQQISVVSQVFSMLFGLISAFILGFSIKLWIPFMLILTMTPFIYTKNQDILAKDFIIYMIYMDILSIF